MVPRSTVFSYKNRNLGVAAIATELRVRALVTGRVVQRGRHLMVSAELIDVASDSQLWGDRLARSTTDIFAVQEEVATEIVKSLRLRLSRRSTRSSSSGTRRTPRPTTPICAVVTSGTSARRDGFMRAIEHFKEAIDRDPRYALAYTGLADTYNVLGYYNFLAPREVYPRATAASMRALELEPALAEAHASLGYTRLFFEWDWEGAASSFRRAISLDPGYASAHQWYAWYLLVAGRSDETIVAMKTALELDPLSLIINAHMGYALFWAGKYDEALKHLHKTVALDPEFALAYWPLGAVHVYKGNADEAIAAFRSLVTLTNGGVGLGYLGISAGKFGRPDIAQEALDRIEANALERYVSPLDRAICLAGVGRYEDAFAWLERAFDDRVSDLVRIKSLPWPADMRNDTRFAAAVARLKLPK